MKLQGWAGMKSFVAPRRDYYQLLRESLEEAVRRIRVRVPAFDLNDVPPAEKMVLAFMVSKDAWRHYFRPGGLWAPFSHPDSRKILRWAGVRAPTLRDLSHLRRLWSGKAYADGLLNEYIARRTHAKRVNILAGTTSSDGRTTRALFPRPKKSQRLVKLPPPAIEPMLSETFGLILFWDQLGRLCRQFAGISEGRAKAIYRANSLGLLRGRPRKPLADFVAGARRKGHFVSKIDEVLMYLGCHRYSQPGSRADTMRYIKYAYLHAYIWLHYPAAYVAPRSVRSTSR